MKSCALVGFVLLALASPAFGAGATRTWVSGVGDDANPCSRTAPCKTFAGAISKTNTGGEIDALDSGGFGTVTITKSITIDGGATLASILSNSAFGVAINIAPGNPDDPHMKVVLRNLSINGTGPSGTGGANTGLRGVRVDSAKSVHLENVRIANFVEVGVDLRPTATGDESMSLDNVTISETSGNGLVVGANNATQTLNVLVRNSKIESSRGTSGVDGERGIGISADTGAHVWLTGTTIFDNLIGLKTFARSGAAGVIDSYCNNQIGGNTDNGTAPRDLCPPPPSPAPAATPPTVVTQTVTVPAPERCTVPDLRGLTLPIARRVLNAANCSLGALAKKKTKPSLIGKVLGQKIRAGTKLDKGAKIGVVLGRR
jgi:hypothetical protein